MPHAKFPNYLHLDRLESEFSSKQRTDSDHPHLPESPDAQQSQHSEADPQSNSTLQIRLTGTKLRSYAFAVLTRREYSKTELIEKLMLRASSHSEVVELIEEFAASNYQSDNRVAEMTIRSQIRQGKGPHRIHQRLKTKNIENVEAAAELKEIDWHEQAYQLKIKKFGLEVAQDIKMKAKQIRFLQYRGFEMDSIMKAIQRKVNE